MIRASELAQFRYCARSWWLSSVMGATPSNTADLQHGTVVHQQHGRAVWMSGALRWAAIALIVVAALFMLAALAGN